MRFICATTPFRRRTLIIVVLFFVMGCCARFVFARRRIAGFPAIRDDDYADLLPREQMPCDEPTAANDLIIRMWRQHQEPFAL